ncbi:MAG: PAS domain-containing protein [Acidimicrobiales bacterium]|nr:PAS domain-containing protein [Acidimicrobiales bacterium]
MAEEEATREGAAALPRVGPAQLLRAQEVARVGSWEWDIPGNTVSWSDELYRIFGEDPDALDPTYEAYLERIHPEDRDTVNDAVMHAYASGESFELTHRGLRGDGQVIYLDCRGEVTRDSAGLPVFMLGTAHDVTAERSHAAQLAEAGRQLTDAQRLARLGSWRYDVHTHKSEWSDVMYELYGFDIATYTPTLDSFLSRTHPDDATEVRTNLARAIETGAGWENDLRVVWPNGEERILYGRAEVDVDADGNPTVVRGTRQDVTELRRDEARLRAAEEQFRLAFENAPIGMAVVAPNGHFLRVNPALCAIVGYDAEELLERSFQDITHPEDLDKDLQHVRDVLDGRLATYTMEKRYLRRDRSEVWVQLNVSLVRSGDGEPMHFISQIQDITDRREAEERLRDSENRALLASKMKSQFLANMSHEIRTPMNGVLGMAELLADSALNAAQRSHVEGLRAAADSLLVILNDILDLSKIEAGKVDLEEADFDLAKVVRETISLFAITAEAKGIELLDSVDVGSGMFQGDAARLRQVLANLVGNAVKFTERGRVELCCAQLVDGRVRFDVTDTGIGIPFEAQSRLMSPFEQGDASTTRRFGGTGLGLAIARDLVMLMGGEISFQSEPGVGTTFTIVVGFAEAQGVVAAPAPAPPMPAPVSLPGDSAQRRALLAEDNAVNQFVARAMLERLGWHVTVVENGQEALDTLAAADFDVVILDCQMPVLDGYSAARAIRLLDGPKGRLPIVAMTASALEEDRQRCFDAGMDEFIAKPITKDIVGEALDRVVTAA